jgi:hypothetical protein
MTKEAKKPYEDMATREKVAHQIKYPTYSYAPGKEKKAAATKRKPLAKKKSPSKKLHNVHCENVDTVQPIALPSLPRFSSPSEDFRSTLPPPTPSPQPSPQSSSPAWESQEFLDLSYSDNESPVDFNFDWSFVPSSSGSSPQALSPCNSNKASFHSMTYTSSTPLTSCSLMTEVRSS